MNIGDALWYYEVPRNSVSCFIGRICEEPGDGFEENGALWVDLSDVDGTGNGPRRGEAGSTIYKAIASWSLRAAFTAWKKPPKITYYGEMKLKGTAKGKLGNIHLNNAILDQVTLSSSVPLLGETLTPVPPSPTPLLGKTITPTTITNATGVGTIKCDGMAEFEFSQDNTVEVEFHTGDTGEENDQLNVALTSQHAAQLPWCVQSNGAEENDELDEEEKFIKVGDLALCMAINNSTDYLFVVDIFR